jgi:hypothetical protein
MRLGCQFSERRPDIGPDNRDLLDVVSPRHLDTLMVRELRGRLDVEDRSYARERSLAQVMRRHPFKARAGADVPP